MKEKCTLYRIYKKPTQEAWEKCHDLELQDKFPLYAFTNNKEYYKKFEEMRDMDKFIVQKSKVTHDEFVEFANSNSSCILNYYDFTHKIGYNERGPKVEEIQVLCTWTEKEYVDATVDDVFTDMNMTNSISCPFILADKYLDALDKLAYVGFWRLYNDDYDSLIFAEIQPMGYEYPPYSVDELMLFITLFGDYMKM